MTRRIAVWIAAALIAAATAHAETLALVGGTVHPVSGPDLDGATVLVRDGKIVAVGRNLAVPAEARVVSCAGKQIYPGFVSANTVLGLTEIGSVSGTNDFRETGCQKFFLERIVPVRCKTFGRKTTPSQIRAA